MKLSFARALFTFVISCGAVRADDPWLTGPLLAPQPLTVPKGTLMINPYFYYIKTAASFDKNWKEKKSEPFHTINLDEILYYGITEWLDIEFTPQLVSNWTKNKSFTSIGDTYVGLDFQLYQDDEAWFPSIKLALGQLFPTGKYRHLNPTKLSTDVTGMGSFVTEAALVFYKLYHLRNNHYLSTNFSFDYSCSAPVHVKGYHAYGGGDKTNGKVYPGNTFTIDLSFEFTLTKRWEITLDTIYTHTNRTRFSGKKGFTDEGDLADSTAPASEQFSAAIGLGYSLSEKMGIVGGYWFAPVGRNADKFQSGVVAFYVSI